MTHYSLELINLWPSFRVELEFRSAGFWAERKTGVPGGKPLGAEKEPTTNLAHIWSELRIEPGAHRWEASALTTAPALLSKATMRKNRSRTSVDHLHWRDGGILKLSEKHQVAYGCLHNYLPGIEFTFFTNNKPLSSMFDPYLSKVLPPTPVSSV